MRTDISTWPSPYLIISPQEPHWVYEPDEEEEPEVIEDWKDEEIKEPSHAESQLANDSECGF